MYQHLLYLRVMGQHSLMYLCFCKNTQLSRIDHLHVLNDFFKKQFQVGFGDNTVFDKMKSIQMIKSFIQLNLDLVVSHFLLINNFTI